MTDVRSVPIDLDRYLGLWYEIGRLPLRWEPDHATDVTAEYTLQDDGSIQVDNRCFDDDQKPTQSIGRATPVEGEAGQLKVTFLPEFLRWIPFTDGDYWVLAVAADYSSALVGSPDAKYLWMLSRTPELDAAAVDSYRETALSQGFDLAEWIETPQTGNRVTDEELAEQHDG